MVISAHWTGAFDDQEGFSDEIARELLVERDPNLEQWGVLRIVVIRGYNMGIARAQVSHVFQGTPAEWRERLGLASPAVPPGTKP